VSEPRPNPPAPDLVWVLSDADREDLRTRFLRSVTTKGNAAGPQSAGNRLVVEAVVPSEGLRNGVFAICEFEERDGTRRLASIRLQSDSDRTLLKVDLTTFPLVELEEELDRALRDRRAKYGLMGVADVLGEIGNLPGPKHAPTRKNSNWPKLLHAAVLYSELCSHPETKTRAHQFFIDQSARNEIDHDWSSDISASSRQMSAQLVLKARDVGFLKATAARSRGGDLTWLAKYLQRKGFVDGDYAGPYDHERWRLAIEEYYGDPMPSERREELTEWFAELMPADHARQAVQAVADRRIEGWLQERQETRKEDS